MFLGCFGKARVEALKVAAKRGALTSQGDRAQCRDISCNVRKASIKQ